MIKNKEHMENGQVNKFFPQSR